jgi:GDP-4-dehydro-6-deoxy-D-mannose reductase
MRALVTGADGFVGQHLLRFLLQRGYPVAGTFHKHQPQMDQVEWSQCDVRHRDEVDDLIRRVQPDQAYHLAAISSPAESFAAERLVYDVNFWGTFNVLEAVRRFAPQCRVLYVGSAQCYGRPNELPITESHEFKPENPYAVSKAAGDLLCYQYFCTHRIHVIRVRAFNHTGPGQDANFVCSSFAKQMAAIELGLQEPKIWVGNLEVERDFSDVRDVARAYKLLVDNAAAGEAYNVGAGKAVSVREILSLLIGLCSKPIEVLVDDSRVRGAESKEIYADIQKISRVTGWAANYNLRTTLNDLFTTWVQQLNETAVKMSRKSRKF